ncbi:M91 family zinc metallopeptidase [Cupriavidus necator]
MNNPSSNDTASAKVGDGTLSNLSAPNSLNNAATGGTAVTSSDAVTHSADNVASLANTGIGIPPNMPASNNVPNALLGNSPATSSGDLSRSGNSPGASGSITSSQPVPSSMNATTGSTITTVSGDLPHSANQNTGVIASSIISNSLTPNSINNVQTGLPAAPGNTRRRKFQGPPIYIDEPREPMYVNPGSPWLNASSLITAAGHTESNARRLDESINTILSTNIGRELTNTILTIANFKGFPVTLIGNGTNMAVMPSNLENASNGIGCGSHLYCDFAFLDNHKTELDNTTQARRDAVRLFHELVHVYNNLIGERLEVVKQSGEERRVTLNHEEAAVVGVHGLEGHFSENRFRQELGLPLRQIYSADDGTIHRNGTIQHGLGSPVPLVPYPVQEGRPSKGGRPR